jgi:hypothetical protein
MMGRGGLCYGDADLDRLTAANSRLTKRKRAARIVMDGIVCGTAVSESAFLVVPIGRPGFRQLGDMPPFFRHLEKPRASIAAD